MSSGTDKARLGARLRRAREQAELTQHQVADAVLLPRASVPRIEAGERSVSGLELARLARLFGKGFAELLTEQPSDFEESPLATLYRLAPALEEEPHLSRQVQHCLNICREGKALEEILGGEGRVGAPEYKLHAPRGSGDAAAQGASIAESERARLGLGDAPIADMPRLLNSAGVRATALRLPSHISGLFLNHPSTGKAIVVNLTHGEDRRRFSYAHEYGHALVDTDRVGSVSSTGNASDLLEKRANAFAASFLIPASGVFQRLKAFDKGKPCRTEQPVFDVATDSHYEAAIRPKPGSQRIGYQEVVFLADWFKVSYQATTYRLRSLDVISQQECDAFLTQEALASEFRTVLRLWGEHTGSTSREDKELVAQIAHLAIEAYRREEISQERLTKLARLLGLAHDRVLSVAQAAKAK